MLFYHQLRYLSGLAYDTKLLNLNALVDFGRLFIVKR